MTLSSTLARYLRKPVEIRIPGQLLSGTMEEVNSHFVRFKLSLLYGDQPPIIVPLNNILFVRILDGNQAASSHDNRSPS